MPDQVIYKSPIVTALLFIFLFLGCDSSHEAQKIVDRAIKKHGGNIYRHSRISFDFRGRHYIAERKRGRFTYIREFENEKDRVRDIFSNEGFTRMINGDTADLMEERANAYRNSTNSVIYFALLPYGLNDPSVNKEYIGRNELKGKYYHKVKVTFDPAGETGKHQDTYIFWFDTDDYSMDYFTYLFHTDGGGIRFREARNVREVNGIVFSDYNNFALSDTTVNLASMDSLYIEGKLDLLSEINLENIEVEKL